MEIVILPILVAADTKFQVLSDVVATEPGHPQPWTSIKLRSRSVAPPD